MSARIGFDLDNTIILYDDLFVALAQERGFLTAREATSKRAVREHLWKRPGGDGDLLWQELQALAYGSELHRAKLAPGAIETIASLHKKGAYLCIVSHKTKTSPVDARKVNLHEAAISFLRMQGMFTYIPEDSLYFETSRADKIARIATLGVGWFVDDLPEVFNEPGFPPHVKKILFAEHMHELRSTENVTLCQDWRAISKVLHDA